jgi:hypothetical protein
MTGCVGIFWGIPGSTGIWHIITDATRLEGAEPYGDFLTHPRGHFEVWTEWQKQSIGSLVKRGIPEVVAFHEYEDFPRGRIVYNVKSIGFILYADRRLQHPNIVSQIAGLFALEAGTFIVRSDSHYRS